MVGVITFDEALAASTDKPKALMIGNGFSIRHFSYNTLLSKSGLSETSAIRKLFDQLGTVDFELVIRSLETASNVSAAYEDHESAGKFEADATHVREILVKAVRATHPNHKDEIQHTFDKCCEFLGHFEKIYTLNYDLLLYWIALETGTFQDGFGLGKEQEGFLTPFKPDAYCSIYNLHGGLHLFQNSDGSTSKRLKISSGIIDAISETITSSGRLPLYVAEGTSDAKLFKIKSIQYLWHCYLTLMNQNGNLFVYGHAAKPNDAHIYRAIFGGNVEHIYYCAHLPTTDLDEIHGQLSHWQKSAKSKVTYSFVDSESVAVWPDEESCL